MRTRVSKVTYGNFCHIAYDPKFPDHKARAHKVFISVSGNKRISESFDVILPKVSFCSYFPFSSSSKLVYRTNDNNFLFYFGGGRIRKLRSRRNSDDLILGNRVLRLILNLEVFLFGVIVEVMRIRSGKMLTPVRNHPFHPSLQLFFFCVLDMNFFFLGR